MGYKYGSAKILNLYIAVRNKMKDTRFPKSFNTGSPEIKGIPNFWLCHLNGERFRESSPVGTINC